MADEQIPLESDSADSAPLFDAATVSAEADSGEFPGMVHSGEKVGDVVGRYHLLEVIGSGGFGTVFLAERRSPHVQRVALKTLQPERSSHEVISRFEAECQAMALLDHSNIAKIYDAGTTEGGRPYFVMELVDGEPITEWCDSRLARVGKRLELFVAVCDAVEHAHKRGIVHRDLKPANILVGRSSGQPKVIDFGVAKALAGPLIDEQAVTRIGGYIGTPEYMSPEQSRNDPELDSRSDVYALGVVLYELLCGQCPFSSEELRADRSFVEGRRIIQTVEPQPPGARIGKVDPQSERIASVRGMSAAKLKRVLRDELEWIPMKAMQKAPADRYSSAGALAADVRRYLREEPIEAGRPTVAYKLTRLVRRYRTELVDSLLGFGLAGVVAVVGQKAWLLGLAGVFTSLKLWRWIEALPRTAENAVEGGLVTIAVGVALLPIYFFVRVAASIVLRMRGSSPRRLGLGIAVRPRAPRAYRRLRVSNWRASKGVEMPGGWLLHLVALSSLGRTLSGDEAKAIARNGNRAVVISLVPTVLLIVVAILIFRSVSSEFGSALGVAAIVTIPIGLIVGVPIAIVSGLHATFHQRARFVGVLGAFCVSALAALVPVAWIYGLILSWMKS